MTLQVIICYLCSVATKLLTSLEFILIHCATTLCHYGGTLNGYVANNFNLVSGYVFFPERSGQNEEQDGGNKERAKSLALIQKWI